MTRPPQLDAQLDTLRHTLHRVITDPRGDGFAPLRVQKDLARRLNMLLGSPLCTREEAAKRREARARLASLRAKSTTAPRTREAAPVLVYFEKDRNARELERVEETLKAKGLAYKLLDVAGDPATVEFVTRRANCKEDDLPVVFVADKPIGGFRALVDADVSGELAKAVYGAAPAN